MKRKLINQYLMMKRIRQVIIDNPIVPANAEVTALSTALDNAIEAFDEAAAEQADGKGDIAGGVATKRGKYSELRDFLKDVARVARSLDRDLHPGVAEHFVLPRSRAYAALTSTARAMIDQATDVQAALVARGLPATFLADLNGLLTAFESGENAKIVGLNTQVSGTTGLTHRASLGMKAATKLDAIMRAHFRNDPVKLEVWTRARHVQLESTSPDENPDTPPLESGSGTTAAVTPTTTAGEGGSIA